MARTAQEKEWFRQTPPSYLTSRLSTLSSSLQSTTQNIPSLLTKSLNATLKASYLKLKLSALCKSPLLLPPATTWELVWKGLPPVHCDRLALGAPARLPYIPLECEPEKHRLHSSGSKMSKKSTLHFWAGSLSATSFTSGTWMQCLLFTSLHFT